MTRALSVVSSNETVWLSQDGLRVLDYVPASDVSVETRTETIEVMGITSNALTRARIQTLENFFTQARQAAKNKALSRVYLELSLDESLTYRSEIVDGEICLLHSTRSIEWLNGRIHLSILITCKPFWEGEETQIPLSNGGDNNNLTGLTVYNHDDMGAQHDNWVTIAAADVVGDLPAPPRLEITNNYNSGTRAATIFVAHNIFGNFVNLNHILEAESATGGTPTEDSDSSGGYYNAKSWAVTTETELLDWIISTTLLTACAGNYFRLLLRLATTLAYSDLWLRVKIKMELTTIWESEWSLAPNGFSLFELATAQLPAYLAGEGDIYPAHLVLYGKRATAGTHTLNVDFLQLSPLDGWRKLQPQGYNLGYLARLVDDMIEDHLYTDSWDTPGKLGNYYTASAPLALLPNKTQRLYFLHDTDIGGGSAIIRTFSLKVFYRPRRRSI
jgi:hypothetical protein